MPVILHLGMPKCGSSAIQSYLSSREFHEMSSDKFVYLSIKKGGEVSYGEELVSEADNSPHGYSTSHNDDIINSIPKDKARDVVNVINSFIDRGFVVIISNEGWGPKPDSFSDSHEIFSKINEKVEVIGYVRPQVEWINSAWWQWGAWSDVGFDRWVSVNKKVAQWGKLFEAWEKKPWVKSVTPRLMNKDVVEDFIEYISLPKTSVSHSNGSLPGSLLRFFQNHRDLRPGPHSSAIEFVLSKIIDLPEGKTPWVVSMQHAEDILSFSREDNLLLDKYLSHSGLSIVNDDKWWLSSSYSEKNIESPEPINLPYDEIDKLLHSALSSIDKKMR